jgi:hypothetical protein
VSLALSRRVSLLVFLTALAVPGQAGAAGALDVIPFPGTPDASPKTQIILSSLAPADVVSLSVRGSLSGRHAGHLVALPAGAGTAFVPARPFSPGESVRVTLTLRSPSSGGPRATRMSYSFAVARRVNAPVPALPALSSDVTGPPTQHFRSRPDLHPPVLSVTSDPDPSAGDIFVDSGQVGVLVLDPQGNVLWFHPLVHDREMDVAEQHYQGQPVLTWWQGQLYRHARDMILDRHYREVAAVQAGNGYVADAHEFQITPQGTALIDAYVPTRADLSSVGGSTEGPVLDCVIQEVDIKTGRVLWEWHALGHIPLPETYMGRPSPTSWYDPFHLNSIQQLPGGNLLISLRNTWAVYEIDKRTGHVVWTLGGKHSSFKMGPRTKFEWQHDARLHPDGTLSLFDDGALPQEERQSSAKLLSLNLRTMRATLLARYTHSPPLLAGVAGSTQILPDHNLFVDWGSGDAFSEYTPGGRQIFNGRFPLGMSSYRAYRFRWTGEPLTRPALAVSPRPHGVVRLYASWNGASRVAAWQFLAGPRRGGLRPLGATVPRTGFETAARRHTTGRYYAAQALDRRGRVLATSGVLALAASPRLHVIPFPGTPDASPQTRVIFSSLLPRELSAVTVRGSRSGFHPGHLKALPDRAGTALALDHPLTPGEEVRVTATLRSPSVGDALGDPGARRISFSFGVGMPAGQATSAAAGRPSRQASLSGFPTQHFRSRPDLRPPAMSVTSDGDPGGGDTFLTANDMSSPGPMILDGRGRLLWFDTTGPATNLDVQRYQGHPVLTWWQGKNFLDGEDVIVDRSYRTVAILRRAGGYLPDLHEFQITPQGTALVDAYVPVRANLRSVGGPANGVVLDCVIQERDIKSDQVLWEWHALGHVPLNASYTGRPSPTSWYDYFHLNSIQQLPDGNLLISSRDTWAVYEISRSTGSIIWKLGGKRSSFAMGPGTKFEWQHDARLSGHRLTLFDDGALPQEERQSSAKVLRLNFRTMKATLLRRITHSPSVLAGAAGNVQTLPGHRLFVGWGTAGDFSEYGPDGRQIFNGSFPLGVSSYRSFRFPWIGRPLTRPSLAVSRQSSGAVKLYASWNGATQVAAWRVLGGSKRDSLRAVGADRRRTGFETTMLVHTRARLLAVQALSAQGKVLATSRL